MIKHVIPGVLVALIAIVACSSDDNMAVITECFTDIVIDQSRGACNESLTFTPSVEMTQSGDMRTISANSIPEHNVGLFGGVPGALNPNAISEQSETYSITLNPIAGSALVPLLNSTGGVSAGPQYAFGILLNGVELDPVAAEPFPHTGGLMNPNVNWEWNLEALNVQIGLDCNSAHVQPTGKYHYHGKMFFSVAFEFALLLDAC